MTDRPGQIALLAALVSILVTGYLINRTPMPQYLGGGGSRVEAAISRMPVDIEAAARVERLQPRLASLHQTPDRRASPLDLALLGYREIVPPAAPAAPEPQRQHVPEPYRYVVSMTYVSEDRRFAVINGRFYREGGKLPGGERVVAITPNAVRVALDNVTRRLEIETEPAALTGEQGVIRNEAGDLGGGETPPAGSRIEHADAS